MIAAALSLNPFHYAGSRKRSFDPGKRRVSHHADTAYVGRCDIPKRGKETSDKSAYDYVDVFPEFAQYKLPSRTPADERHVLDELCSNLKPRTEIAKFYLTHADDVLRSATSPSLQPAWFVEGMPRIDDVLNAIQMENRTRHPGYPACVLGTTKGTVIDQYLPDLVEAVYVRLLALTYVAPYCRTPEDFHRTFCSDLTAFSIKSEVVKTSKYGRGLCAVSIVTSVCEFLLYGLFDVSFKQSRYETYSAIGIGFSKLDSELLHAASPHPHMCSDVPSFDSTVDEFENILNAKVAMASQGISSGRVFEMAIQLERAYAQKLFILSNGWVYAQLVGGYQCTGRRETSNFNTMTRARRSMAADLVLLAAGETIEPLTVCAGDDCNETPHHEKEFVYASLEFPLRDVEVSNLLTFCSHDWPLDARPVGQRIHKSAFKLFLSLPLDFDRVLAFCREYSEHPNFQAYLSRISAVRPEMNTIILEMYSKAIQNADVTDYECFTKKRGKIRSVANVQQRPQRRLRGRGDYVEPTPAGFAAALSRIEDKFDKSRAPSVKNAASSVGRALGSLVPLPGASELGATAGDWLAKYFGHGDYSITSNSLIPGSRSTHTSPPEVVMSRDGKRGVRIVEREYIGDVFSGPLVGGSTAFSNRSYVINPANAATFPWLSTIAQGFEEYEVNGLIFEYRSTSSNFNGNNQALGTVISATDYDALDAPYTSKLTMENAAYSSSCKASDNMHHGVECDRAEKPTRILYTAAGTLPDNADARMYHVGNFQLATFGCSAADVNLGELWVAYDITFYKKDLFNGQLAKGSLFYSARWTNGVNIVPSSISTNLIANPASTLPLTWLGNRMSFPPNIQTGKYLVRMYFIGTSATLAYITGSTFVNCLFDAITVNGSAEAAESGTKLLMEFTVRITGPSASVNFGTGGYPTALSASFLSVVQVNVDM